MHLERWDIRVKKDEREGNAGGRRQDAERRNKEYEYFFYHETT